MCTWQAGPAWFRDAAICSCETPKMRLRLFHTSCQIWALAKILTICLHGVSSSKPMPGHHRVALCPRRVPVQAMQWFFSGTWYDMSRTGDNYFVIQAINSQPLILPAQVKITSIFGDEVIDTVATSSFSVSRLWHPIVVSQ